MNYNIKNKEDRIKIINEIIKEIALRGRSFFLYNKDNDMAYIFQKKGRLYMYNEYNKEKMYLHTKNGHPPNSWHHGGTLWELTKEFVEFIQKGNSNHNNAYGGLYCPHWGYPDDDMGKIQEKAKQLGYL